VAPGLNKKCIIGSQLPCQLFLFGQALLTHQYIFRSPAGIFSNSIRARKAKSQLTKIVNWLFAFLVIVGELSSDFSASDLH
jgi:hypothetical protein